MRNPKARALALLVYLGAVILFCCFMCSCSQRISAALPVGQPLMLDSDRVWIQFENVGSKPHGMSGEWFYYPGIGLRKISDYDAELILINKKTNEIIRYQPNN
ncbi:hypothetical protein [Belliella pelovolcani]|uniref:hypothetical protein n=1 Tax=Belliella pelovolcani TaxID=529505 RepID=UPI00391BAE26